MLEIVIPPFEVYLEKERMFITFDKPITLLLEHSLISISKWESKWHKPFLSDKDMTVEETCDYIRCMTLNKGVDPRIYYNIPAEFIKEITEYIKDPHTATWFSDTEKKSSSKEVVTSELIYYWMLAYQIPFECEKWHLERLITLIRICELKNEEPKKMSKNDIRKRNAALNAQRRAKYKTKG